MSAPPDPGPSHLPLYQRLAERLSRLIDDGTFPPGSRIPSLRKLKAQMGVSIATAMEAYRLLEDRGLIEARPQSGFYVRHCRQLPSLPDKTAPSESPVVLDTGRFLQRILEETGEKAPFSFGAAAPHPSLLPTARLSRILAREVRQRPGVSQSYDSVHGLPSLRTQIARRCLEAGCTLGPDELVTTNGARHAMYLSLRVVTRPGDSVIVETPTYLGLLQVLESLGLRALEIATDPRDGICLDSLKAALRRERPAACVLIPSFGNPLGHCMPDEQRRELVEVLSGAGIPLIEDDVDGELFHTGSRPRAVKAFDSEGMVLLCSSFSKTLAPGYRVGWVAPGRYLEQVVRLKYVTSVATVTPTQMAIASYLEHGGFDRHLRRLRGTYRGLLSRFAESIATHFPHGTKMTQPRGGHVAWVELPAGTDSLRLFERAQQRGISFVPGPLFSASGDYPNFIRLNYAVPWSEPVEQALRTLGQLAGEVR